LGPEGEGALMKFVVIDFETTGNAAEDRIIQVGAAVVEQDTITSIYSSFVKPGIPIPAFIEQLTGIDDEMVKDAPELEEVMTELLPLLDGSVLVAHHAAFDAGFLQRALEECGYEPFTGPVLDTMDLLRMMYPGLGSLQLSMVCAAFGIEHERAHQADSDAEVTARILLQVLDKLESLPLLTIQRLCHLFDHPEVANAVDMSWFLSQIREQKEQELQTLEDESRYYRQFVLQVKEWTEEKPAREDEDDSLDLEPDFANFYEQFKEEAAKRFPHYEPRESQDRMIHEVHRSMNEDKHLLIEAGTGTGKSLGYLIPALHYSILHEQKVTVSTHTINLQEQLRQRDIPLLNELFPVPFRAAVLKGRSHYLCLRKFEHKINNKEFDEIKDDLVAAAQMVIWLGETEHGDEEELQFGNKGAELWSDVSSDADSCLNRACPWFRRCFYHRAKHQANVADVVITNHSLLFTDTQADSRLLPSYSRLVVDEAHHFEETAAKHLGSQVNYFGLMNTMNWLFKDAQTGRLPTLARQLRNEASSAPSEAHPEEWAEEIEGLLPMAAEAKDQWDRLCESMYKAFIENNRQASMDAGQVVRIQPAALPDEWPELQHNGEQLQERLALLLKKSEKLVQTIREVWDDTELQGLLTDISGTLKDLNRFKDTAKLFMKLNDTSVVYWLEAQATYRYKSLQMIAVPIDVSEKLRSLFFQAKDSIVLTSATLSVKQSFAYIIDQLGLSEDEAGGRLLTSVLPSPFDYRNKVLVCIPRDFPKLKGGGQGEEAFLRQLASTIVETAVATRGRMLVLFTSYRMLKQAYELLKKPLDWNGIALLGQGVETHNRSKLTRWFKESEACVLLGTSSFWEGVDIPGDALTCLAMVRLPFQPPNHPLVEAKCERLEQQNKNPFMQYSVPQAVIRFKQGFGRLIRTSQDQGIVLLFDTRVLDTFYGKHFLYSLPGPKIEHMKTDMLVSRVQQWLERDDASPAMSVDEKGEQG